MAAFANDWKRMNLWITVPAFPQEADGSQV